MRGLNQQQWSEDVISSILGGSSIPRFHQVPAPSHLTRYYRWGSRACGKLMVVFTEVVTDGTWDPFPSPAMRAFPRTHAAVSRRETEVSLTSFLPSSCNTAALLTSTSSGYTKSSHSPQTVTLLPTKLAFRCFFHWHLPVAHYSLLATHPCSPAWVGVSGSSWLLFHSRSFLRTERH